MIQYAPTCMRDTRSPPWARLQTVLVALLSLPFLSWMESSADILFDCLFGAPLQAF